jgi:hypothetical protein
MGGSPTTPRVLAALNTKFNGKVVSVEQLQSATGLNDGQIRASMRQLASRDDLSITVVQKGNVWKYDGVKADNVEISDQLFEVVGTSAKGNDTIVRGDVTGKLYKVVAL